MHKFKKPFLSLITAGTILSLAASSIVIGLNTTTNSRSFFGTKINNNLKTNSMSEQSQSIKLPFSNQQTYFADNLNDGHHEIYNVQTIWNEKSNSNYIFAFIKDTSSKTYQLYISNNNGLSFNLQTIVPSNFKIIEVGDVFTDTKGNFYAAVAMSDNNHTSGTGIYFFNSTKNTGKYNSIALYDTTSSIKTPKIFYKKDKQGLASGKIYAYLHSDVTLYYIGNVTSSSIISISKCSAIPNIVYTIGVVENIVFDNEHTYLLVLLPTSNEPFIWINSDTGNLKFTPALASDFSRPPFVITQKFIEKISNPDTPSKSEYFIFFKNNVEKYRNYFEIYNTDVIRAQDPHHEYVSIIELGANKLLLNNTFLFNNKIYLFAGNNYSDKSSRLLLFNTANKTYSLATELNNISKAYYFGENQMYFAVNPGNGNNYSLLKYNSNDTTTDIFDTTKEDPITNVINSSQGIYIITKTKIYFKSNNISKANLLLNITNPSANNTDASVAISNSSSFNNITLWSNLKYFTQWNFDELFKLSNLNYSVVNNNILYSYETWRKDHGIKFSIEYSKYFDSYSLNENLIVKNYSNIALTPSSYKAGVLPGDNLLSMTTTNKVSGSNLYSYHLWESGSTIDPYVSFSAKNSTHFIDDKNVLVNNKIQNIGGLKLIGAYGAKDTNDSVSISFSNNVLTSSNESYYQKVNATTFSIESQKTYLSPDKETTFTSGIYLLTISSDAFLKSTQVVLEVGSDNFKLPFTINSGNWSVMKNIMSKYKLSFTDWNKLFDTKQLTVLTNMLEQYQNKDTGIYNSLNTELKAMGDFNPPANTVWDTYLNHQPLSMGNPYDITTFANFISQNHSYITKIATSYVNYEINQSLAKDAPLENKLNINHSKIVSDVTTFRNLLLYNKFLADYQTALNNYLANEVSSVTLGWDIPNFNPSSVVNITDYLTQLNSWDPSLTSEQAVNVYLNKKSISSKLEAAANTAFKKEHKGVTPKVYMQTQVKNVESSIKLYGNQLSKIMEFAHIKPGVDTPKTKAEFDNYRNNQSFKQYLQSMSIKYNDQFNHPHSEANRWAYEILIPILAVVAGIAIIGYVVYWNSKKHIKGNEHQKQQSQRTKRSNNIKRSKAARSKTILGRRKKMKVFNNTTTSSHHYSKSKLNQGDISKIVAETEISVKRTKTPKKVIKTVPLSKKQKANVLSKKQLNTQVNRGKSASKMAVSRPLPKSLNGTKKQGQSIHDLLSNRAKAAKKS